jgi:hypothetical protein
VRTPDGKGNVLEAFRRDSYPTQEWIGKRVKELQAERATLARCRGKLFVRIGFGFGLGIGRCRPGGHCR